MTWTVYLFVAAGFAVGNLPDHSAIWSGIKLVFAVLLLAGMLYTAKKDIATQYHRANRGGARPPR